MRDLTSNALDAIAEQFGNEPINIVEVAWNINGSPVPYADRDIASIPGKILSLSDLDNIINVAGNGQSQEIQITLDDVDGSLRSIINTTDIHQRDVWVYQTFEGLAYADKFLLFRGKISSPITYSEGDRSLSFTITSQIEDTEIGFSAEEGQFDFLAENLIGKPWPMNFGTVVHGETLRLDQTVRGILAEGTGVADFALPYRFEILSLAAAQHQQAGIIFAFQGQKFTEVANETDPPNEEMLRSAEKFQQLSTQYLTQANDFLVSGNAVQTAYTNQLATQLSEFRVIGGALFPRGAIQIRIGETLYNGAFEDDTDNFVVTETIHPKTDELAISNEELEVPQVPGGIGLLVIGNMATSGEFALTQEVRAISLKMFGEHAGYVFNEAGSTVELVTAEGQEYIVSITPGTVLQVSAHLNKNGVRKLVTIPEAYYTVEVRDFGDISATIVRITDALSKIQDGDWEDDIYVTFESDIGPNTVEVLEYLIDLYTDFAVDSASFAEVTTRLANYPSHFQIIERKQILQALQEIAWQARCAIWLSNGTFFIRYLPAEPTAVDTFTDSDIDVGSMEISFTSTESVTTKFVCRWKPTAAQEEDNFVILRHNVAKYGTKEQQFDFYIYNHVDLVIKSATFWLIRYANTWKKLKFRTPIAHKLVVESLDPIELDFNQPWVANAAVTGIAELANYNSEAQQLDFEVWLPIRAGEMVPYDFANPADISQELRFPTNLEEELEFDGGVGPGKDAGEGLSLGVNVSNYSISWTNEDSLALLESKRRFNDRGQQKVSDVGDASPGAPVVVATPTFTPNVRGPFSPPAKNEVPVITAPSTGGSGSTGTITFTTPILDNTDPENPIETNLGNILLYDETLEKHGARLAYLYEETP